MLYVGNQQKALNNGGLGGDRQVYPALLTHNATLYPLYQPHSTSCSKKIN